MPGIGGAVLCVSWRCAVANCNKDSNKKIAQPALICMASLLCFETNRNFDRKDSDAVYADKGIVKGTWVRCGDSRSSCLLIRTGFAQSISRCYVSRCSGIKVDKADGHHGQHLTGASRHNEAGCPTHSVATARQSRTVAMLKEGMGSKGTSDQVDRTWHEQCGRTSHI